MYVYISYILSLHFINVILCIVFRLPSKYKVECIGSIDFHHRDELPPNINGQQTRIQNLVLSSSTFPFDIFFKMAIFLLENDALEYM